MAFWYVMPVAFVPLVGLGAAAFVNLVFNRDEQRNPWAEALALTYRNHVIVFGAGHVGHCVIRDLVTMGLDVVAIDQAPRPCVEERLSEMGVPVLRGDGRHSTTLDKARLDRARAFVACTGNDQVNMEAIMKVRYVNPDVRIVSRMWDRRFTAQLKDFLNVQSVLSSPPWGSRSPRRWRSRAWDTPPSASLWRTPRSLWVERLETSRQTTSSTSSWWSGTAT